MSSRDRDLELLNWVGERLLLDPVADAAHLEQLLAATPATPFTDAEIKRILQKSRGEHPLRHEEVELWREDPPVRLPFRSSIRKRRVTPLAWAGIAAAACVLLAVGAVVWNNLWIGGPNSIDPGFVSRPAPVVLAQGQARLYPASDTATKLRVQDAEKGHVTLEGGSVFLEMKSAPGTPTVTEVDVPALAKVATAEARCHVVSLAAGPAGRSDLLAVIVLDGQVHVHNGQGYEMAEGGEVVFVEPGQRPERLAPVPLAGADESWSLAQETALLLVHPEVQDELKLEDQQRRKLSEAWYLNQSRVEAFAEISADIDTARRRQQIANLLTAHATHMLAVLRDDQAKRFTQMRLQQAGVVALLRQEVSESLQLTRTQRDRIAGLLGRFQSEQQKQFVQQRGTSLDLSRGLAKVRQRQNDAVLDVLKADQRAKWQAMLGQPEFSYSAGIYDIDESGLSLQLLSPQPYHEEQTWAAWLFQANAYLAEKGPGFRMTVGQLGAYGSLLQSARKEAGQYRLAKHQEFKQLAAAAAQLRKQHGAEPQRLALEQQAESLELPIAQIGQRWRADVRRLLSKEQRDWLDQIANR